jgi:hypothetical protein
VTNRGRQRAQRPRQRQELHHRLPRAATKLGAVAKEETLEVVRRVRPHPKVVVRLALLVFLAVITSSSTFWFVVLQEDAALRVFFPVRRTGGLVFACVAWGMLTQVLGPLTVVRRLQLSRRLYVSRSLQLVIAWSATSIVSLAFGFASRSVSGWFMAAAAALLPAAFVLYRLVKAALASDA